jgi:signal transduction histidine kinase
MTGLHLARQIIELHGGTFHFPSTKGMGTTIIMALPKK